MNTKMSDSGNDMAANSDANIFFMKYRRPLVILFHLFTTLIAYVGAFYIRFDFKLPSEYLSIFYNTLLLIILSRMAAYFYYNTYSASWRFAYLRDLIDVIKAVIVGSGLFVVLLVFMNKFYGFPRSVILLEAILSIAILSGTKFLFRYYNEYSTEIRIAKITKNVLIVGAGKAGVLMLNEIRSNRILGINAVGFVDDDSYLKGTYIQGVPVLGKTDDIPELAKRLSIDEVIIAIPASGYKDIMRITKIAEDSQVKIKVLPSLGRLIQDGSLTNQLKDVVTDNLLGRRVIKFCRESDFKLMEKEIKDKSVLITGAAGSIGSELCRQVAQFKPNRLILYERYENGLYDLELEVKKKFPNQQFLPVIGDILDTEKIRKVLGENKVNLIYHAAAYKHVPMMEREPVEAVRNNVVGTLNVARIAREHNVSKFVLISTDKAVNPANIMGATKRVAELIMQGLNGNDTRFIAVRFGNVIGSNGSVIPLFRRQISEGGPITITHPDVRRYFMAIPEAVQLVMTAGAMGNGSEIFLLDMGEPIRIVDLAKELIRYSGLEPEKDIDITFTGLRPGEKLYEELYWQGEGIVPTENKKITMLRSNGADYNTLLDKIKLLGDNAVRGEAKEVLRLLKELVPEATINDIKNKNEFLQKFSSQ